MEVDVHSKITEAYFEGFVVVSWNLIFFIYSTISLGLLAMFCKDPRIPLNLGSQTLI